MKLGLLIEYLITKFLMKAFSCKFGMKKFISSFYQTNKFHAHNILSYCHITKKGFQLHTNKYVTS